LVRITVGECAMPQVCDVKKGNELYVKLLPILKAKHPGKYAFCNIDDGTYVVGANHHEAADLYKKQYGYGGGYITGLTESGSRMYLTGINVLGFIIPKN
jgi:hypothetical protein